MSQYTYEPMNYTVILCNRTLRRSAAGRVFKIFVDRKKWNVPCAVRIPRRVFVFLLIKFHKSSTVTVVSGNGQNYSHTGQLIIPKLHDVMLYGPVYVPCRKAAIVIQSRGFDDSLVFSFSFPSKKFLSKVADPLTCEERYQSPQIRRIIGYVKPPWVDETETNLRAVRNSLKGHWEHHRLTAFDPLPETLTFVP